MMPRRTALTTGHVLAAVFAAACSQGEDVQEMTFDTDVRRVVIEVDAGSIDLRGSDWGGVAVLGDMDSNTTVPLAIGTNLQGDTLHVSADCPDGVGGCEAGLRMEVPRDVSAVITTKSGNVKIGDVSGDLEVSVEDGSVSLFGVGGHARIEVVNGNVAGMDLLRGNVWGSTENGNVGLHFLEEPSEVAADTVRGNVDVTVPDGKYDIFADSVEGNVDVQVLQCGVAEQQIFARSTFGNVSVHY